MLKLVNGERSDCGDGGRAGNAPQPAVLFLDHTAELGGAELFLETLAGPYKGRRKVVLFSNGPLATRLEHARIPVQVIPATDGLLGVKRSGGGIAQLLAIPGVLRLAMAVARDARGFDVIFANSQKALVVGALAARFARKPLAWYLHDIVTADHFSAINRKVSVFLGNHCAARVIANSEATRRAFIDSGGRPEHVSVVYNGIDAADIEEGDIEAGAKLRRELGLSQDPIVGVFSRLAQWKGQHVLLSALVRVPRLQLILVGAPLFGEESRYLEQLEAQVRESGTTERVRFLGFREDIPQLLQAVDIVAHTSVAPEPFGRVIVEGMLARKPVVATRAGGACEIIEDGLTGRLVTPGSVEEMTSALSELLANPSQSDEWARAGFHCATKRFSVDQMSSGIAKVLNSLGTLE